MNKTVSINLGGQAFQIDENAFEKLKIYLESIKARFSQTEGKEEIITDIETRIGEMFWERLSDKKQVITLADVNEVVNVMGRPEEFDSGMEDEESAYQETSGKKSRRLYRNPDEKVIGGVCSGLSAFLGISDPLWIRLIFLLAFFFGVGSSLLIYVILWIIVPEAKTASEKLHMRGENINISNIEKTIREDLNDLKDRISNINTKENINKAKNGFERLIDLVISLAVFLFRFILKLAAILLIIVGIVLTIGFLMAIFIPLGIMGVSFPALYSLLFTSSTLMFIAATGMILLIGIPAVGLIYLGFRILLNHRVRTRGLGLSLFGLWILGLLLSAFVAAKTAADFRVEQEVQDLIPITQPTGDILYLDTKGYDQSGKNEFFSFFGFDFLPADDNLVVWDKIKLDVKKSRNENFELEKVASARGSNKNIAYDRAQKISYVVIQNDSQLVFPDYFTIHQDDLVRDQEVKLVLRVPEGKSVYLGHETRNIIYDIKNVHNTYDGNMVDHTWAMLSAGLTCVDCDWQRSEENYSEKAGSDRQAFDYSDFDKIEVNGTFQIDIRKGKDYHVSVSGNQNFVDNIEMDKSHDRLKISTRRKIYRLFKDESGRIEIITPSLTEIEINGANESTISGFDEKKMSIKISGASTTNIEVEADELQMDVNGASHAKLSGRSKTWNAEISGASKIDAFEFEAHDCSIEVSGASKAEINVSDNLHAAANGASSILYKGLPKISSDVSGFSSIKPQQ